MSAVAAGDVWVRDVGLCTPLGGLHQACAAFRAGITRTVDIMVIIGGYETFVSRLNLEGHPDQPEWLSEVNAGTMKVKLSMALIFILQVNRA